MLLEILKILLLLFAQFQLYFSLFEDEYPGIIICQNDNLQEESIRDIQSKLKILNLLLIKNCTHIQGSLYIRGFTNLPENFKTLNLDTIKEIDGHLIIEGNDFERISLKNLRIIRGLSARKHQISKSFGSTSFSLEILGNLYLKELDFNSLQSINDHNVIFDNNPLLTYLPHRIYWRELFTNSKTQKIVSIVQPQDLLNRDKCSDKCMLWINANHTYCWGASNNQCQKNVLCGSKYSKDCETCFYKDGKEETCCSDQCIGGCVGFGPTKCIACKNMLNEDKCTESCPGRYSGGIGGTTQNKGFKYHTGSFCSKMCPKLMLPEDSTCVHKCSDGYFKNKTNHCVKCYGDMCKKEELPCEMMSDVPNHDMYLSSVSLKNLTNCTKIRGYIIITSDSFNKYGITVKMLYDHLSKLEDLEGGFSYFKDSHLKNLTFLGNLKIFRSATLHSPTLNLPRYNRFSVMSTSIEFLGLKSLKTVIGNFLFRNNTKLCYMNFPVKEIVSDIYSEGKEAKCDNKVCHKECSDKGCWGPGNQMCFECRNFNANGICVSDCTTKNGFYFPKNSSQKTGICLKCHPQCARTCTGPGPHECQKGCLNKRENGTCVAECSNAFYSLPSNKQLCLPCSSSCTDYNGPKCTGPSAVPGRGGCNKCSRILLDRQSRIIECVKTCPSGTFNMAKDDENISKYYLDIGYTCFPCHQQCSTCRGKSNKKEDCETCKGFWYKNSCQRVCPINDFYNTTSNATGIFCNTCHSYCANGCTGPNNNDCKRCRDKKVYYDGKLFYCNKSCPSQKPVEEIEESTGNTICLSTWESTTKLEEIKRIKVTVAVVMAMLVLVILVIITIVVCLRKKANAERVEAELKAQYSNLTEPNSKDEDFLNKPPNMGRLVIVSKEDLIFEDETRPLGFGAFGYVYKGKWRIPKEEDSLLKKTTSDFYLPVAIKVIKNMGNEELESIMQEAKMMASVSHMHCLRFIGVCLSYEKPCLISAYVKEGSLDKYLVRNKNKITSLIMLSWSEQIADGMLYLTKRNIIHRDLAARNVLVNRLECVQITDFGLAKMLESTKEKEIIIKTGKVPIRWLAIETLTEGKYSHETDVWAYGVTLWEIFTFGKVPYEDQATHDIFDFVLKGGRLSQPDICSLDVYILMVNCWLESPNLRPDFQNLMKTFMDYCKNPGRYLSIQGDPYEIPSPNALEMTNLNNPYYGDQFFPTTAETMLPLLNHDLTDRDVKDFTQNDANNELELSTSDKESLPTRTMNRTSNLFKRFQENRQPQNSSNTRNSNTPRFVSLASQEEPHFRNPSQISEDDPRYVADPTDKLIKMRQPVVKPHLLQETPRFHSNITKENNSLIFSPSTHSSNINEELDGYLEPVNRKNNSLARNISTDAEGYLEPLNSSNKGSTLSQDEYMVPSQPNTPRESLFNNKPKKLSSMLKESKNYITMDEENSPGNSHFSKNSVDDEYLEPEPSRRLINSSHR